jgi:hypothetical protein
MSARGWLSTRSGSPQRGARGPAARAGPDAGDRRARRHGHLSLKCAAFAASGATDKTHVDLSWAGHYLQPVGADGARLAHPHLRVTEEVLLPWLRVRWPI